MTSQNFEISIVIPCHNAEKFLEKTIGYLCTQLRPDEELILVENGSTDETYRTLEQFVSQWTSQNIKITQSPKGLGLALKHGVLLAKGKKIVFMEDDLPFGLQELNLARNLNLVDDYLIMSKYHGNLKGVSFRKIQGLVFVVLREIILKLKVKDSQATFLGDAIVIKKLAAASKQSGFLVTLEFIALARKTGIKIVEIPCESLAIPIRPTTLKFRDAFKMFLGLFEVRRSIRKEFEMNRKRK